MTNKSTNMVKHAAKDLQWHCKYNQAVNFSTVYKVLPRYGPYEKVTQIRSFIEDCLEPSTKMHDCSELVALLDRIDCFGEARSYILHLAKYKVPSLQYLEHELNSLLNRFKKFEYNTSLSVVMGPYTINEIEFGEFRISLDKKVFGRIDIDDAISLAYALTPKYPINDSIHTHPHVRGTSICLGRGHGLLQKATNENRITDCFEIVDSVLKTYNQNDPYCRIENWTRAVCQNCDYYYEEDEATYCEICGAFYCKNCIKQCCSNSQLICHNCRTLNFVCKYCGELMCVDCVSVCDNCHSQYCSQHIKIENHRCMTF